VYFFSCLSQLLLIPSTSCYINHHTREDRTENQTTHWQLQIDLLVDDYLDYHFRDSGDGLPAFDDMSAEPLLDDSSSVSLTNIELIDLFSMFHKVPILCANSFLERSHSSLQSQPSHRYPNETLIYHGYIGCAPLYPTAAISLHTLATYHQIHWSCPRFSIQAQVKSLCFLHDVRVYYII
jgi:hypothetical protein